MDQLSCDKTCRCPGALTLAHTLPSLSQLISECCRWVGDLAQSFPSVSSCNDSIRGRWQGEILRTEVKCWIEATGERPTALTDDQLGLGLAGCFFFSFLMAPNWFTALKLCIKNPLSGSFAHERWFISRRRSCKAQMQIKYMGKKNQKWTIIAYKVDKKVPSNERNPSTGGALWNIDIHLSDVVD